MIQYFQDTLKTGVSDATGGIEAKLGFAKVPGLSNHSGMISSVQDMIDSVETRETPPEGLSAELCTLWHIRKGEWERAHNIAQDIGTGMGSWLHAHLHLIEGDIGNAGYWYHRAGKPARERGEIGSEWCELVEANL